MTRRLPLLALPLVAAALVLLPAAPASAHAALVSSSPADGATVRKPVTTVVLTFDEAMLDLGTDAVAVTDSAGRHYERACPTVSGAAVDTRVVLGGPGEYRATWRVVSGDGHVVSDSIAFRYAPPAGTARPAGRADGIACRGATVGTAAPSTASTGPSTAVIAIVAGAGAAVLATLAVVIVVVLRLRRGDTPT